MRGYHSKEWQRFRETILESDNHTCVRCGKSKADGVVLQVHHKAYMRGKFPWESPPSDCETLCKGCHAEEHGRIRPRKGWEIIGDDDLGDRVGECDICGTELRYTYFAIHPDWEPLEVGCDCADRISEDAGATRHHSRKRNFLNEGRWSDDGRGGLKTFRRKAEIFVRRTSSHFLIEVLGKQGKERFQSIREAQNFLFEKIEDGSIDKFIRKYR